MKIGRVDIAQRRREGLDKTRAKLIPYAMDHSIGVNNRGGEERSQRRGQEDVGGYWFLNWPWATMPDRLANIKFNHRTGACQAMRP
jgi:hypothetical protein